MNKLVQIIANLVLYGFLVWLMYGSLIKEWDPWFGFVVAFVIVVAIIVQLMPGLHAERLTPGEFHHHD